MSELFSLSLQPHHPKPRLKAGFKRNVRVAITDYKLPTYPDPTIQPRGTMPFPVDERAVNDYYPSDMLIPVNLKKLPEELKK